MNYSYKPRPIDNEKNQPRRVAREAFRLLDNGNTPRIILSDEKSWEIGRPPNTVIVPKGKLDALKYGMTRAAMETAIKEARMDRRKKPGFFSRLELLFTKWEIARFIKEAARAQRE